MHYDELVKLALFCAKQARTANEQDVASRLWRMAVQYRDWTVKVGEPPDIGEEPVLPQMTPGAGNGAEQLGILSL